MCVRIMRFLRVWGLAEEGTDVTVLLLLWNNLVEVPTSESAYPGSKTDSNQGWSKISGAVESLRRLRLRRLLMRHLALGEMWSGMQNCPHGRILEKGHWGLSHGRGSAPPKGCRA